MRPWRQACSLWPELPFRTKTASVALLWFDSCNITDRQYFQPSPNQCQSIFFLFLAIWFYSLYMFLEKPNLLSLFAVVKIYWQQDNLKIFQNAQIMSLLCFNTLKIQTVWKSYMLHSSWSCLKEIFTFDTGLLWITHWDNLWDKNSVSYNFCLFSSNW